MTKSLRYPSNYEEAKLKLKTMWENYNSTRMELRRLKNKLRDMESSGQLISGLATPICLFGALIIIRSLGKEMIKYATLKSTL